MAELLSESLCDLVDIEAIDLTDNVLTDISLEPLMHSICSIVNLQILNLSSNSVGYNAAKALSEYLSMSDCPLKTLILHNADIGDYECESLITSIKVHCSRIIFKTR